MLTALKVLGWLILALIAAAALLLGYLTLREYKPDEEETVGIEGTPGQKLRTDRPFSVLSWNIGFCALGKDADFVMDGGGNAPPATPEVVSGNLQGIAGVLQKEQADVCFLQEVDAHSKRSFSADQRPSLCRGSGAFALNFSSPFVPFPFPPIGKVESGIYTTSPFGMREAKRIALPCPFKWPLRIANLKRCLLITRMPVEGSSRELVFVNFHLEAYDSGEGKIEQTKKLLAVLEEEYRKGNYVIAGGDWNQTFPGVTDIYPNTHPDIWTVGLIDTDRIPDGWTVAYDPSVPTCRLLNRPYDPADTVNTQYYVIDGFVMSPNVRLCAAATLDEGFVYTDHNPVRITVELKQE
ncbi:MAG: endonuclease [Lachnospiraceae bacterium]|nr:endonuclease [Lachnospiraceae bacterium]